jgi:hypothetical protein
MQKYAYMIGGLSETVSPEEEERNLNECAEQGWELVSVVFKRHRGKRYTFFYFRKELSDNTKTKRPRFEITSFSR